MINNDKRQTITSNHHPEQPTMYPLALPTNQSADSVVLDQSRISSRYCAMKLVVMMNLNTKMDKGDNIFHQL